MERIKRSHFAWAESHEFKAILESWIKVQRKYDKEAPKTIVADGQRWQYRERPCIGFLSAAAWKVGGVALEEAHTRKRHGNGRRDLFIRYKDHEFFIEAKHMYSCSPNACKHGTDEPASWRKEKSYLERELKKAVKDAKECLHDGSKRPTKLGVLFVALFYSPEAIENMERNGVHIPEHFPTWLKRILEIKHLDAYAWQRPPYSKIKPDKKDPNRWASAGVLLLARRAN